ncbi:MAG TPA: spore coat protein CotH [Anaerolineaceae bacterium]|nr:spore coat protein CotH [Anaerolineaceae bacterium]
MKKIGRFLLFVIGILIALLISTRSLQNSIEETEPDLNIEEILDIPIEDTKITEPASINDTPFVDNMDLYQNDDPASMVYMYVTVREGNSSDNTDHTWQEVNDFTKFFFTDNQNNTVGKAEVIFQIGDENGPTPGNFGYREIIPNGTIQVRGNTASLVAQKSYKIELFDSAGEWRGQSTITLNKHVDDITRTRNKLCFDLLKDIDGMVSLQTQFVHLFVKDETSDPASNTFVDYGLFTQIEQPNRTFLRNHMLDQDAQLYKPTMFEFYRYPDQIRKADDPLFNRAAFETVLEIKGNQDHSKLIQMLDDVNNWSIPIETIFETYFDADNYFTWMAFNIIMGNVDTDAQNFYLYSPQNSQKWYFLAWDYDGSLARQENVLFGGYNYHLYQKGIANYWGVVLHQRVLSIPQYRAQLDARIQEILAFITPEHIQEQMNLYRSVTDKLVLSMPDLLYLPGTLEDYELIYRIIPDEIQINYQYYLDSLEAPMPFYLGEPQIIGDKVHFYWDEAYDFDAQDITYQFTLSKNWGMSNIVFQKDIVNFLEVDIPLLEPGEYFWKVTAVNEDGKMQYAFDYFRDAEGGYHDGMKYFYVRSDGLITSIVPGN